MKVDFSKVTVSQPKKHRSALYIHPDATCVPYLNRVNRLLASLNEPGMMIDLVVPSISPPPLSDGGMIQHFCHVSATHDIEFVNFDELNLNTVPLSSFNNIAQSNQYDCVVAVWDPRTSHKIW